MLPGRHGGDHAEYAIRVSEREFGYSVDDGGHELRSVPLYAAFCIGDELEA